MRKVKTQIIEYAGWKHCLLATDGIVEIVVTIDVGPRIISYGFTGDRNEFCVWNEQAGLTGGDDWRCYGGSRLWHGPEIGKRCYEPDNDPVEYEVIENGLILRQKTEQWTKMAKETRITFLEDSSIRLDYKITNESPWDADVCIWVLTLMEKNGICIIPAPKQTKGIAPNSIMPVGAIAFWPYTSLKDPRFNMGEQYFRLEHDPENHQNFKIGMPVFEGWVGYLNDGHLFVKYYEHLVNQRYPDFCSSFELYCCERYTEIETLSPMKILKEGESITHHEIWALHKDVKRPANESEIHDYIRPFITK
jgi:hypothetical protein